MKIDSLDRFLEGKISICLYCRYDINVSEKVNKNKLDHKIVVQKPAAGRIFFAFHTRIYPEMLLGNSFVCILTLYSNELSCF